MEAVVSRLFKIFLSSGCKGTDNLKSDRDNVSELGAVSSQPWNLTFSVCLGVAPMP